ncbi:rRNA small subunit methyltransferase I [Chitinispirillum alkaliphilum]|nr:rRNA small subunit methyltransferase I [Chitinispirillum alkaliphilum]
MSLYIVSTPIGNLSDITLRAIEVLKTSDLILAEDTRVTNRLLNYYGVQKPLRAYHDHNKEKITPHLLEMLRDDKNVALVTDAGTPGIADPAFYLTRASIEENIKVIPIPGASAFLTALVASGLPTDRFIFENFLPNKSAKRKKILESMLSEPRTVIFYETPHRINKTLLAMKEVLEDTRIVIARELTKVHEEFLRGDAAFLLKHFEKHPPKGEMVVMFNVRIKNSETEQM